MHLRKYCKNIKQQHTKLFHSLIISSLIFIALLTGDYPVFAGSATLTWDPPTTNVDQTPLTDLAGYKVYYGTTSGTYSSTIDIGNVINYTVSSLAENTTYYFAVTAYDTLANESSYSNEVSKTTSDTAAPVISGVSTSNITNSGATITWNTDEASTSQIEYGTTTSYGSSTTIDNNMVTSHSVTVSGLLSWTTYHFKVKSQDAASNLATSGDFTFSTLAPPDTTPPTGTITINNNAAYATTTSVTLTLTCSDTESTCAEMRLSNNGTTWNAWETYAATKSWTLTSGDGMKTVYVKYKDNASNISSNYTDNITLDSTTPTISGIGAGSISSSTVVISWTTNEASTTQVEYGTTISYGSSTTLDTNLVTSHSVSLTGLSFSTAYHYRVKSRDEAGNLSISGDLTFTTLPPQDITSPTGTILINNGAAYATSTSVMLTLSCTDIESTCAEMQLSNDGNSWNSWETYATTKSWVLTSGDGAKTVYVKYKDNASNISSDFTDTITLDSTSPTISGIGAGSISSSTAIISWTTNEASTTQVEYGTTTSYGSSTTLDTNLVTSHSVSLTGLSPSTTYNYRVLSRDAAGNLITSTNYKFTTSAIPDTTAPVISGIGINNITSNGATIKWTTNEPATSQVEYGTSGLYGSFSNLDSNLTTSHTVMLSGLSANTVYHFRVISVDLANNKATSSEYTFTTLKTTQPDTPAAIMDLRVQTSGSTRNTAILEWTATGADGNEGTATDYDLRISELKIIEDGVTPLNGEINFSNAQNITGLPIPGIAGTLESFKVDQLNTNSVYYVAIKAKDEKGNVSSISNVINSDKTPPIPVTAIRQGYTMISFPLNPTTTDTQALLGAIVGDPVELYQWSSTGLEDASGSFTLISNVSPGRGYFIKANMDSAVLNVTGTAITDSSWTVTLQPGWNMIGNPYPAEVDLINTYIKDTATGNLKNFQDAVIAGWIGNAIYNYNGSTYDFSMYTQAKLRLWQGYWLALLQDGQYEMIIYKP